VVVGAVVVVGRGFVVVDDDAVDDDVDADGPVAVGLVADGPGRPSPLPGERLPA
jgi:hypothetical protein